MSARFAHTRVGVLGAGEAAGAAGTFALVGWWARGPGELWPAWSRHSS